MQYRIKIYELAVETEIEAGSRKEAENTGWEMIDCRLDLDDFIVSVEETEDELK